MMITLNFDDLSHSQFKISMKGYPKEKIENGLILDSKTRPPPNEGEPRPPELETHLSQ